MRVHNWMAGCLLLACSVRADEESASLQRQVNELRSQIASLTRQLNELDKHEAAAQGTDGPAAWTLGVPMALSGEGAVAFFDTGDKGAFPNSEFRADEARLFLDARLAETAFFFTELNLYERESDDAETRVGEIFLEFEGLAEEALGDAAPTLRAGRIQIPFGEEYAVRYAKDDPLISHSLADLWGVDEGVSLFGSRGAFDWVVAVQNGGYEKMSDGDSDKSVAARVGVTEGGLRVSASAMRTGDISVEHDEVAELWFGDAYLSALGDPATTTSFAVELAELDARWSWKGGSVGLAGGTLSYSDDDSAADNGRDATYGMAEVVQDVTSRWYGAGRYSWIRSGDGYHQIFGQGGYDPETADRLTDNIWRLSLGLGCRLNKQVTLKSEYSWERGEWTSGEDIKDRDQMAVQAVYAF